MFCGFADNINAALASKDLAVFANFFNACSNFHVGLYLKTVSDSALG